MAVDGENHEAKDSVNPHILEFAYAQNEFFNQKAAFEQYEERAEADRVALLEALSQSGVTDDDLIGSYFDIINQHNDYRRVLLLDEALRLRPRLQAGTPIIPTTIALDVDMIAQPDGDGTSVARPLIDEKRHILAWRVQTTRHPEGVVIDDSTVIGHDAIMIYLDAKNDSK